MNLPSPARLYVLESTTNSVANPAARPGDGPDTAVATVAAQRRRFRAADVARHLDMTVIGDVCVGVSLAGYRSVLDGFLSGGSGSLSALLAALDAGQTIALPGLAHAVKGTAASMGLRTLRLQAQQIEVDSESSAPLDCSQAATSLRAQLATTRALLERMGFV